MAGLFSVAPRSADWRRLAAGCPDFHTGLFLKINSAAQKRTGPFTLVSMNVHTHSHTHPQSPPAQPTQHSLTLKAELASSEWASHKGSVPRGQSPVSSFPPHASLESPTCSDQALYSCFPLAFTPAFCCCRPLCEGFLFPPSDSREGLSPPSDPDS